MRTFRKLRISAVSQSDRGVELVEGTARLRGKRTRQSDAESLGDYIFDRYFPPSSVNVDVSWRGRQARFSLRRQP